MHHVTISIQLSMFPQWIKASLYSQCGPVYRDILVTSQSPHSFSQCPKKPSTRSLTLDIRCKTIWLCCCLISVLGAIVKREKLTKMLNLHFSKEQRGSTFLEKTDTQLSHSSFFIKIFARIIEAGKGPNYQSNLVALATHESRQSTQVSVSFDYG